MQAPASPPSVCVFAPSPLLTITVEGGGGRVDEIHLHAGGQGFWVARMLTVLGVRAVLCGSFGGETGRVARDLMADEGIQIHSVASAQSNGAYVHDRRSGERQTIAYMPAAPLSRHEVDELYGASLVEGLEADVCVLGGPSDVEVLPADTYRRLAADLARNGRPVVADLSGEPLDAVLASGVSLVKVSHEDLLRDGRLVGDRLDAVCDAATVLADAGAANVVVTRGDDPAVALIDGHLIEIRAPTLEMLDRRGAGDSLTAGVVAGLAQGREVADALRLGAAAGALNVTRRGLATGNRDEIERLAQHVELGELSRPPAEPQRRGRPHASTDHQR